MMEIFDFIVSLVCFVLFVVLMIKTPRKREVKEDKGLRYNSDLSIDSVENWCKNVETCPVEAYDIFDLLRYNFMVPRSYKNPFDEIYFKRIENYCTYTISKAAVCFLADRTINLAMCTMLCAYLQYQAYKRNLSKITRQDIRKIFPNGLPSEETWKKLWYQQKVFRKDLDSDNLLDYKNCYESIINIGINNGNTNN